MEWRQMMIVVTKEEIESRWETTTHDERDNVQRANIFYWPQLGFKDGNFGRLAFMHWGKLKAGKEGYFSLHHHGEKQDPKESDPQIGMLEVFHHKYGKAEMTVDDKVIIFDENTPVVVVHPGEVHSMINLLDEEFVYIVFGYSTGGGTWNVD